MGAVDGGELVPPLSENASSETRTQVSGGKAAPQNQQHIVGIDFPNSTSSLFVIKVEKTNFNWGPVVGHT